MNKIWFITGFTQSADHNDNNVSFTDAVVLKVLGRA